MARRTLVTLSREHGSGGREIGKRLAQMLQIGFYDKELLEIASKQSGISREVFEANDEKPINSQLYTLPFGRGPSHGVVGQEIPLSQKLFLAQFDAIRRLAAQEDCVIVGRCADYALRDEPDCLRVFIYAPLNERVARIKQTNEMTSREARELIRHIDKKRAAYHNDYADTRWGEAQSYHICLDSSLTGIEGAAVLLRDLIRMRL